jgi:hypothetical protein
MMASLYFTIAKFCLWLAVHFRALAMKAEPCPETPKDVDEFDQAFGTEEQIAWERKYYLPILNK